MDNKPEDKNDKLPDPEKFFNEKEYNTIKIGGDTTSVKPTDPIAKLIVLLGSKIPGEKDAALLALKKENAAGILIEAIKNTKNSKDKALLLAASWESGIDLKDHLDFFAAMALDEDLIVSMEAITALSENIAGITKEQAQSLLDILVPAMDCHLNLVLSQDVIDRLKQLI